MRLLPLLFCLASATVATVPLEAQALGGNEYVAGAALNVALRGPYVASSWRGVVPRFVLGVAISAAYEKFVDVNGWNSRDVGGRLVGYVATEALVFFVRKVVR